MENLQKNYNTNKKYNKINKKDSPKNIKVKSKIKNNHNNNMTKNYANATNKKKNKLMIINDNNYLNKKEGNPMVNSFQNFYTNKSNNLIAKSAEFPNKIETKDYNINYLSKRYNIIDFSHKKEKNIKNNLNDLLLNIPINNYKFNKIKTKLANKSNNKMNISYYSDKNDNEENKRKINLDINNIFNHTIKIKKKKNSSKNYKQSNNGINKEFFKSYIVNKYSTSFVHAPIKFEEQNNLVSDKRKNVKSFEYNKFKHHKNKNKLNNKKPKLSNLYKNYYCPTAANHKIKNEKSKKELKLNNNKYQMTDFSASFSQTLPLTINKINFQKSNPIERINSHKILITNININLYNKENENHFFINSEEKRNNIDINLNNENVNKDINFDIDLEKIYILEEKLYKILKKVDKYVACEEECIDWIIFNFENNLYSKILSFFKKNKNINKINDYLKLEIICFFLCYDISSHQNYSKASILIKTIINILYENYIIIMKYILFLYQNNNTNNNKEINGIWIEKIELKLNEELKINLNNQDMNENSITDIIINTFKNIYNYYDMIIDNLYSISTNDNSVINNTKLKYFFPNCLNLDIKKINLAQKKEIISLFFSSSNKYLNLYDYQNMKKFFYLYINTNNKNLCNQINNNNNNNKNFLPQIKPKYKYSLIINIDETLIYYNSDKNKIILRPNIFYFLSKMKEIYEIIFFSFYPDSIINKALDIIQNENKKKFIDHVIYSDQLTLNINGKIMKDLENLGRNLKNVIVIDTKLNILKKFRNNLIIIRRFYGDETVDINLLKILGCVLINIRNDNYEDDIRIALNKYKKSIKNYLSNDNNA